MVFVDRRLFDIATSALIMHIGCRQMMERHSGFSWKRMSGSKRSSGCAGENELASVHVSFEIRPIIADGDRASIAPLC